MTSGPDLCRILRRLEGWNQSAVTYDEAISFIHEMLKPQNHVRLDELVSMPTLSTQARSSRLASYTASRREPDWPKPRRPSTATATRRPAETTTRRHAGGRSQGVNGLQCRPVRLAVDLPRPHTVAVEGTSLPSSTAFPCPRSR